MGISKKFSLVIGIVFGSLMIASPLLMLLNKSPEVDSGIKLTLLSNAGVRIESEGVNIYVDPFYIAHTYEFDPADVLCITHPHTDHYVAQSVTALQKEGTINIFPESMTDEISLFNATGVVPEEEIIISDEITISTYYMYTNEALHARENNWTSYLIDISGMVFFFGGDSDNITEYQQLSGLVDVAVLNYVPNFLMNNLETVNAINTIQPQYVMLVHATFPEYNDFNATYGHLFNATFISLDSYTSYQF